MQHLNERIQNVDLPKQLRHSADYLMAHPHDVAMQSLRQVAKAAAVSPATLIRLAKALGYPSYQALKQSFQNNLHQANQSYAHQAAQLITTTPAAAGHIHLLDTLGQLDHSNIATTLRGINAGQWQAAVHALANAETIYVIGLRQSMAVAHSCYHAYRLLRKNIVLIDNGTDAPDHAQHITANDAVLAIAFQPFAAETVAFIKHASRQNAHTISLTDQHKPAFARHDKALPFYISSDGPTYLASLTAGISLSQGLIMGLIQHWGSDAVDKLKAAQDNVQQFKVYG